MDPEILRGSPRAFIRQSVIARDLGISPQTLAKWMNKGIFPYMRVAGKRRVTRELYEAWLLENTEPGVGPRG